MNIKEASVFVTGGAGCLGRAIAEKRKREGWTGKFTVYSRDTFKHERMRKMYPDVNFVQGDILSQELLYNAMVGHDVVIHAAACKVIPTSEYQSIDTYDQNVNGSLNVCAKAVWAGIKDVLGISTDKVCHAANAYGSTKYLMEKTFQEYSRMSFDTQFHLVRFGNVLESTGSVVEAWRNAVKRGEPIKITKPEMTRFFLSPAQAANYAIHALDFESGEILIPIMPALSIGKLAEYVVGESVHQIIPLRPGEKIHETLLTVEEQWYARSEGGFYILSPSTSEKTNYPHGAYSSDIAPELTREELEVLLRNE